MAAGILDYAEKKPENKRCCKKRSLCKKTARLCTDRRIPAANAGRSDSRKTFSACVPRAPVQASAPAVAATRTDCSTVSCMAREELTEQPIGARRTSETRSSAGRGAHDAAQERQRLHGRQQKAAAAARHAPRARPVPAQRRLAPAVRLWLQL